MEVIVSTVLPSLPSHAVDQHNALTMLLLDSLWVRSSRDVKLAQQTVLLVSQVDHPLLHGMVCCCAVHGVLLCCTWYGVLMIDRGYGVLL